MVISDLHPSVGEVADGLGAEVMSGGTIGASTGAVPSAVASRMGIETEHEGATNVGRSLGPIAHWSQHLDDG